MCIKQIMYSTCAEERTEKSNLKSTSFLLHDLFFWRYNVWQKFKPGTLCSRAQWHFHFLKGTFQKGLWEFFWKGIEAKFRGNRGHCLHVILGLRAVTIIILTELSVAVLWNIPRIVTHCSCCSNTMIHVDTGNPF